MRSTPAAVKALIARVERKRENEWTKSKHGEDPIDPATTTVPTPGPQVAAAVVMGVSGSGKSTIGEALAARLGWEFVDGDALHPPANVAKMRSGQALNDVDREPWLDAIAAQIDAWIAHEMQGIVTCSALKRGYRRRIIGNRVTVRLIYLAGSYDLIAHRLAERRGHFMPARLLDSQFATLEPPAADETPITVDIGPPVATIVDRIVTELTSPTIKMPASP